MVLYNKYISWRICSNLRWYWFSKCHGRWETNSSQLVGYGNKKILTQFSLSHWFVLARARRYAGLWIHQCNVSDVYLAYDRLRPICYPQTVKIFERKPFFEFHCVKECFSYMFFTCWFNIIWKCSHQSKTNILSSIFLSIHLVVSWN